MMEKTQRYYILRLVKLIILWSILITIMFACLIRDCTKVDYLYILVDSILLFTDLYMIWFTYKRIKEELDEA
ncbi:MAG: hypothetical protein J6V44_03600 [Methanobrevibacter sp.]|nr:hypothetical protein [Methanobrevibacter sp.]